MSAKQDDAARAARERARHAAARSSITADGAGRLSPREAQRSPCGAASRGASNCIKLYTKSTSPTTRPHAAVEPRRAATACPQPVTAPTTRTQPPIRAWHAIQRQRNHATAIRRATRSHGAEHARSRFASARRMRHERRAIVWPRSYLCGSRSRAAEAVVMSSPIDTAAMDRSSYAHKQHASKA